MGWINSRGAPRQLPYDATPLRSRKVDVQARVAWLLRTTRMASPLGGTGLDFCRRLDAIGVRLDQAGLSRREQGEVPFSAEQIAAYETLLDRPVGSLLGVCDNMTRSLRHNAARPARELPPDELRVELDRVSQLIRDHHATGGDWLSLSHLMTQSSGIVLPAFLLDEWNAQLVDQLARAVGPSYVSRIEALCRLMTNAAGADSLVRVIKAQVREPGMQAADNVLVVWGEGEDDASFDAALELLSDVPGLRQGASAGLLQRVVDGRLDVRQVSRLVEVVRRLAREAPQEAGGTALTLARRISPAVEGQVRAALGRPRDGQSAGTRIENPVALDTYLDAGLQAAGLEQDRMLERLLREALSTDFQERRHQSLLLIAASPYADAIARAATVVQHTSSNPIAVRTAAETLTYLPESVDLSAFREIVASGDPYVRGLGLIAAAHGPGIPDSVDLRPYLHDPQTAATAVYAAGMSGHHALLDAMRADMAGPVRAAARWWASRGPAVRDPAAWNG